MAKHRESDDPIKEIYAIRRRISERYGNNVRRLGAHYIKYQQQFSDRLISRVEGTKTKRGT